MSTTKLRDDMVDYIVVEGESEEIVCDFTSPCSKDKNNECHDLDDKATSDEHHAGRNESQVVIEHSNENGISNELKIPSGDASSDESNVTKTGIVFPSGQMGSDVVTLKQTASSVLDKVNIPNGDSKKNELHTPYAENGNSEDKVILGDGETTVEKEISYNEDAIKDQVHEQVSSIKHHENSSIILESIHNNKKVNLIDSEILNVMEEVGSDLDAYSDEESVEKETPTIQADSESLRQFKERVISYLNSNEMQSKMKAIDNLIKHMATSTFKPETSAVEDEIKRINDARKDGPDTEVKSMLEDGEMALPKRKSKQSEFEDPEELQLIAKKLKMSKDLENAFEGQSNEECQGHQFRLAYEKTTREVPPGQRIKDYNFAANDESSKGTSRLTKERMDQIADDVLSAMSLVQTKDYNFAANDESSKETSRLAKERLDQISDNVFSAMSLDEDFHRRKAEHIAKTQVNWIARISESRGIKPENVFYIRTPDNRLISSFDKESNHEVNLTEREIQALFEAYIKTNKSDAVPACAKKPSDPDEAKSSTLDGKPYDAFESATMKLKQLLDLVKTTTILGCLLPFLLFTCFVTNLFALFLPSEKYPEDPKVSRGRKPSEDGST